MMKGDTRCLAGRASFHHGLLDAANAGRTGCERASRRPDHLAGCGLVVSFSALAVLNAIVPLENVSLLDGRAFAAGTHRARFNRREIARDEGCVVPGI